MRVAIIRVLVAPSGCVGEHATVILVRISGACVSIVTMTSKKILDNKTSDSARKRVSLQQNTRSTKIAWDA